MLVHNKEETLNVDDIIAKVDGQQIDVDQVSELTDAAKIKKVWFFLDPDINEIGMNLALIYMYVYIFLSSFTKLHQWRKGVGVCWMLLCAGWPQKMLRSCWSSSKRIFI